MSEFIKHLKQQMGYTDDNTIACKNCLHCDFGVNRDPKHSLDYMYTCQVIMPVAKFEVDKDGRCRHFTHASPPIKPTTKDGT